MKKGDTVWVGKIDWHGTKWYKHEYVRTLAGGEFVVVKTNMEFPWTFVHVPVENVLTYDPMLGPDE